MAQACFALVPSAMAPRRSPIRAEVACLPAARPCRVGRRDGGSASRKPGSHLRHAAEPPSPLMNRKTASAPQSAASRPPSTVAALLNYQQLLLPSKPLRGYLLPLIELEPKTAPRLGGLKTTLTSHLDRPPVIRRFACSLTNEARNRVPEILMCREGHRGFDDEIVWALT